MLVRRSSCGVLAKRNGFKNERPAGIYEQKGHTGLVRRWWWLQILIGGVLLLYVAERVLLSSQDPVFIPSVLLIGAFLVPVVFVTCLYEYLPDWGVPLSPVATCFVWGEAIGTVVAGALEFGTLLSLGWSKPTSGRGAHRGEC